jgi:hypothetical protein
MAHICAHYDRREASDDGAGGTVGARGLQLPEIVLQLREGEDDLLNGWRLRSIIEKYSDPVG